MLKSNVMIFGANGISSSTENTSLKVESDGRLNFISSWQNYFVSRDQYWEQVVSYPTANLIELYKIIRAEIEYRFAVNNNTPIHRAINHANIVIQTLLF